MKNWQRMAIFLVINILVSACTTYAVLFAWERTHSPTISAAAARAAAAKKATPTPAATAALQPTPTREFVIYTVISGDTFESIAQAYGVPVAELLAVNGFPQSQPLGDGETLRIPLGSAPAPAAQPAVSTLAIEAVVGPGDLATEQIILRRKGAGDLNLAGWQLKDMQGNTFSFPAVELLTDGATITVFSRPGADTAEHLFWGLEAPLWKSGAKVILLDPQGVEQAVYTVP
jgi:hypothetical protein